MSTEQATNLTTQESVPVSTPTEGNKNTISVGRDMTNRDFVTGAKNSHNSTNNSRTYNGGSKHNEFNGGTFNGGQNWS